MKQSGNEAEADAGRAQRSANLVQLLNLTGIDRVSKLVRQAEHRYRQSSDWRRTVGEIEASLGLNTEHKA